MVNKWFTSDNHFWHKNILKFCRDTRQGEMVEEMNELMVQKWNSQVSPGDHVYCLGDFSFGKPEATIELLGRLNGDIHLIIGNHDGWLNHHDARKAVVTADHYKKLRIDGKPVILFHYPIVEFEHMHHGGYHLYGHVHGSYTHPGRAMDVGVDARPQKDMGLWHWDEVEAHLKDRPILKHH